MHSEHIAISARDLTKSYRLFGHPGDRVKQFFSFGLGQYYREFEALKNINFDIKKGETVGIIGKNGSGKSTLLQLVCGILKPSSGTVHVNGSVSALLELGAGFNPEFTGRENVFFQGALMGLKRAEMALRFDGIEAFAGIGEFIDQPVRMYSSGMYLRLAFAVAVSVDSDILVVDEALAVGDPGFRARCYRRIGQLRDTGCTILFVSHDLDQVARLCGRVILLDEGEDVFCGAPEQSALQFQRLLNASSERRPDPREQIERQGSTGQGCADLSATDITSVEGIDNETAAAYEPNGALIEHIQLVDASSDRSTRVLSFGQTYKCLFRMRFTADATYVRCALLIMTQDGYRLGGAMTASSMDAAILHVSSGTYGIAEFQFRCLLNPGIYLLSISVLASTAGVEYALHGIQNAILFRVEAPRESSAVGAVDFDMRASFHLLESAGVP